MVLNIEITNRARKYGYIFWKKSADEEMRALLNDTSKIKLWFNKSYLGKKNVDWKHRRISLGWKQTRKLESRLKTFSMKLNEKNNLVIICI